MSTKDRPGSRGWTDMASPSPTARYRQPSGKLRCGLKKGKLRIEEHLSMYRLNRFLSVI